MSCSTGTIIHNSTTNKNQFPPQISDPASAQLFLTTCRYYSCTWYLKYGLTGPAYGKRVTPSKRILRTCGPQADNTRNASGPFSLPVLPKVPVRRMVKGLLRQSTYQEYYYRAHADRKRTASGPLSSALAHLRLFVNIWNVVTNWNDRELTSFF